MKVSSIVVVMLLVSSTLSAQPLFKWVVPLKGPQTDEVNALAISPTNTLYVAGTFTDSLDIAGMQIRGLFQYDGFMASFTKAGVPRTAVVLGGLDADDSKSVVVDNQGNVYVAGSFIDSIQVADWIAYGLGGTSDMYIAKYDKSGAFQWVKSFASEEYDENSPYLAVDSLGNVYVGGGVGGTGKFQSKTHVSSGKTDAFIAKLTPLGEITWLVAGGGTDAEHVRSISVTPNGDRIYAAGVFSGDALFPLQPALRSFGALPDFFVWSVRGADGATQWVKRIGSSKRDDAIACMVDKDQKLVVAGAFYNSTSFDTLVVNANGEFASDVFLTRFSKAGTIEFVKKWGGVYGEVATCVYTDKLGGIYVGGYYDSSSVFDQRSLESYGERDAFIMRCEPDGTLEWIREAGGPNSDEIRGIAVGTDNVPYAAGVFDATANFSGITIVGERFTDGFVAALECGPNTRLRPAEKTISICEGQDSVITAPGSYPSYEWYVNGVKSTNGSNRFRLSTLPQGSHTVWVAIRDRYDCQKISDTVSVTVRPGLAKPSITKVGNKLVTDAVAFIYQWYREGAPIPGANMPETNIVGQGLYTVRISDTGGCTRSSDAYLEGATDVADGEYLVGALSVYPNPTNGTLNIQGLVGECEVVIVNNVGIDVYRGVHSDARITLDLNAMPVGAYTVTIRSGQHTTARRIVRQ